MTKTTQLTELELAYQQLDKDHPDLFKGCPVELKDKQTYVKRNRVARNFDLGVTFNDSYIERYPNTWINAKDELLPEFLTEDLRPKQSPGLKHETTKVWIEDTCVTRWKDSHSSGTHFPKWVERWVGCAPGSKQVTQFLPCGLQEQLQVFGKNYFFKVKHASSPRKYEAKERALVNCLTRAFSSRDNYECESFTKTLSLDTCPVEGEESAWTPVTADPLWTLIEGEQIEIRRSNARYALGRVRDHVGTEKFDLLVDSANGMNSTEMSAKYGKDSRALRKTLSRCRNSLASLGCHT